MCPYVPSPGSAKAELQSEYHTIRVLTDQVLVHVVGSCSDNSDFTEQGEGHAVHSSDEAVDVFVTAGLLLAKLVAGERQHVEMIRPKVPLQLLQVFVVFLSEAALAGHVHHQGHLKSQS